MFRSTRVNLSEFSKIHKFDRVLHTLRVEFLKNEVTHFDGRALVIFVFFFNIRVLEFPVDNFFFRRLFLETLPTTPAT